MKYDTWPIDDLLARWLNPAMARSLREFADSAGIPEADLRLIARLAGRGYSPPSTVKGWQEVYDMLVKAGVLPVKLESGQEG